MALAQDFFGRTAATFDGAFSADDALMTFPGIVGPNGNPLPAAVPMLLQQAAFSFNQQITRLFDLTSNNIYYVAGRSAGQGSLSQILGPRKLSIEFLRTYGNVCKAATNTLDFTLQPGGCDADGQRWSNAQRISAAYVVIDSIGINTAAQSMVIQSQLTFTYSSLGYVDAVGGTNNQVQPAAAA